MMQASNSKADQPASNTQDAEACGKVWDIYVREAQAYDEGLVKSWKEDMDITLVFSGLYSAILTAFVIESYQNLQPDSTENSAVLLKRISQQLESPANSSVLTPFPEDDAFSPTSSALACNILWFISLALALTCAFLATLVQQWSRRFLHRTSTVRSPSARAHLLQYLYFGLKDLKMHAIVDLIPSLLHLSLFSFFSGLICFLHDVNGLLTWLFVMILVLVSLVYWTFTLLPLVNRSSPYSTPFSPVMWHIWDSLKSIRYISLKYSPLSRSPRIRTRSTTPSLNKAGYQPSRDDEEAQLSLVQANSPRNYGLCYTGRSIVDVITQESRERHYLHESRSIAWTIRSLSDDTELLSFIEVLPDALLAGDLDRVREGNLHLMDGLLSTTDPESNLISRTLALAESAQNPWHSKQHRERCSIACARALYALARVLVDSKYRNRFSLSMPCPCVFTDDALDRIIRGSRSNILDIPFATSGLVLCALSILQSTRDSIHISREQRIPFTDSPIHQAIRLISKRFPGPSYASINGMLPQFLDRQEAMAVINKMTSALLFYYLMKTVQYHSFNFEHVCALLVQNGGDPSIFPLRRTVAALLEKLQSGDHSSIKRVDIVFGTVLDFVKIEASASKLLSRIESEMIQQYITQRFEIGGWGDTKPVWSKEGRLTRLIQYLQTPGASPFDEKELPIEAFQEVLVHACRLTERHSTETIRSFCVRVFRHLDSECNRRTLPKPPLWFMVAFMAIAIRRLSGPIWASNSIFDRLGQELDLDPKFHSIRDECLPHWALFIRCLTNRLSPLQMHEILQFFFHSHADWLYPPSIETHPHFISQLAIHSKEFGEQLLQDPSIELQDINAMIWSIWSDIIQETGLFAERLEPRHTWSKLVPLLGLANKILSPEFRQTLSSRRDATRSPPMKRHIILTGSNLARLNLLDTVKAVRQMLSSVSYLLISLPPPDLNEEIELQGDQNV